MDIIDLTTQQQFCIPAQCFIDTYGVAIVTDTIPVQVKWMKSNGSLGQVTTTVALLGDAIVTRNAEYYGLRFDSLGDDYPNFPGHVGIFQPGDVVVMSIHPTTGPGFGQFNIGPIGFTDRRLEIITTAKPVWTISGRDLLGSWTQNGWTWARKSAGDGRAAGPVCVVDPDTYNPLSYSPYQHESGEPDAIHYNVTTTTSTFFDGYRLHCCGVNGIQDGTPWHEAYPVVHPQLQLLDHAANLAKIPVEQNGGYTLALGNNHVAGGWSWWWCRINVSQGSESLRAAYRQPATVSARLFLSESPEKLVTAGELTITQDLAGFQLLPYRYRILNGKLIQEFAGFATPDSWWQSYDVDAMDSYTIAYRECIGVEAGDPATLNTIDYFHPTAFTYSDLVLK